jgi:hypothetical protein
VALPDFVATTTACGMETQYCWPGYDNSLLRNSKARRATGDSWIAQNSDRGQDLRVNQGDEETNSSCSDCVSKQAMTARVLVVLCRYIYIYMWCVCRIVTCHAQNKKRSARQRREGVRQDDVTSAPSSFLPLLPSFDPVPHINTQFSFPERPRKDPIYACVRRR